MSILRCYPCRGTRLHQAGPAEASSNQEQRAEIAKALEGDYRKNISCLQTALELYDSYQFKIMECDQQVKKALAGFEPKVRVPAPDLRSAALC